MMLECLLQSLVDDNECNGLALVDTGPDDGWWGVRMRRQRVLHERVHGTMAELVLVVGAVVDVALADAVGAVVRTARAGEVGVEIDRCVAYVT